jgi:hypothetical protein
VIDLDLLSSAAKAAYYLIETLLAVAMYFLKNTPNGVIGHP